MEKNTLFRTNFIVCFIILIGFVSTSFISYQSNIGIYEKDIERVSTLTAEGMYSDISTIFAQPVSVSLTMANDSLLKNFLSSEDNITMDKQYLNDMKEYLNAYKQKYNYDSVFLVSTNSNRYYHFEGVDRVLTKGDPENQWYYDFLNNDLEYYLNVDNDQATQDNSITIFVNCKIKNLSGSVIGIVGVGMKVNSLQELLKGYEDEYNVSAYLIDETGTIEISSQKTGYEATNLFDIARFGENKNEILSSHETRQNFWYENDDINGYVVSQYEPNLKWHLVVENNTSLLIDQLHTQLFRNIVIIGLIIIAVIITITVVMKKYNAQIVSLKASQELEYQRLLNEATQGLYKDIFEWDITHNRAGGTGTAQYFQSLGLSADEDYDVALTVIAAKHIKEEYISGYLETFAPKHVMEVFEKGINNLTYDFMISEDGKDYRWMRISAQIFFWSSDESVRMITYRQIIDDEKKREFVLLDGAQKDSMTGLYNKRKTEELVAEVLKEDDETGNVHAFLVIDIDNFKAVNDCKGHSFGDQVINEFAAEIKSQFMEHDIVGRIGGDEFAVLMKNYVSIDVLQQKLDRLCGKLANKNFDVGNGSYVTCSVGVSLFPDHGTQYAELFEKADQSLYFAKGHGKNSSHIFGQAMEGRAFHTNQRDMEILVNAATDGIAKFACTEPLTVLYFNEKCLELTGCDAKELSKDGYNPFAPIHPDDVDEVRKMYEKAKASRALFSCEFRMKKDGGEYFNTKVQAIFIDELYENKYPVFYAMYIKRSD